jgi:twitching motility protein PilT
MININMLLKAMMDKGASDLHLRVGVAPAFRLKGDLFRVHVEPLSAADMEQVCNEIMRPEQKEEFEKTNEYDFAVGLKGVGRFRINACRQRGTVSFAIRAIKTSVPVFTELSLPNAILDIAMKRRGLILVTGTTGSAESQHFWRP